MRSRRRSRLSTRRRRPYNIPALFEHDHIITFSVRGHVLGKFKYSKMGHSSSFTMFQNDDTLTNYCVKITVRHDRIVLEDYFYKANNNQYDCVTKPTSTEQHKMFLRTLLNFIAFAFKRDKITLLDGAEKKFPQCPSLQTLVFLVAGEKSFYEKMAGFKCSDPAVDAAATAVGKLVPRTRLAIRIGGARYGTLREVASAIIQRCKAGLDIDQHMRMHLDTIESEFIDRYINALPYARDAGGTFEALVTDADGKPVYAPLPREIFIDIREIVKV